MRRWSLATACQMSTLRRSLAVLTSGLERVGSRAISLLKFRGRHGQARHPEDQARKLGRHGLLLRHQEESAQSDREARLQEIRSGRAQARRVQGSQDQIAGTLSAPFRGQFCYVAVVIKLVADRNAALTRRPLNRAPAGRTLRTQEMRRT